MTAPATPVTGGRLPALTLPARDGGPDVALRAPGRLATVLAVLHTGCARCQAWLTELAAREADLHDWDGRVIAVYAGPAPHGEPVQASAAGTSASSTPSAGLRPAGRVRVVADPGGQLARAGVAAPAVLVADQWGELFVVEHAGAAHTLLAPDEIIDWLRYLAVQCPECQGEAL